MIDKSAQLYDLFMIKTDTDCYPESRLPEGYSFVFYNSGDERKWARLEVELGQFDSVEDGVECFKKEFLTDQSLRPEDRMLFVKAPDGEYVATLTLWNGNHFGREYQRAHWLAVSDKCAGKGIAKALLSRVLQLYNELGFKDFIYLVTGSWFYPAIFIYRKYGFKEYTEAKSLLPNVSDSDFAENTRKCIEYVDMKLAEFK